MSAKTNSVTANTHQARISIPRQVQMVSGSLGFIGIILAAAVHPAFMYFSGLVALGTAIAGLTGVCLMGKFLAFMPWNQ